MFASAADDYWLRDRQAILPPNLGKPSYASPLYKAGNDYPLTLQFVARRDGWLPGRRILRVDRVLLQRLYGEREPTLRIVVPLERDTARRGSGRTPPAIEMRVIEPANADARSSDPKPAPARVPERN